MNVLDISQTVLQEYFTMIMLVDASACTVPFAELTALLRSEGEKLGLEIRLSARTSSTPCTRYKIQGGLVHLGYAAPPR